MQRWGVFDEVDAVFGNDPIFSRNLKIYLCHRHTGEKLESIGNHFGISDSAVSHARKRARRQIGMNRKLKKKIKIIEKKLFSSGFMTSLDSDQTKFVMHIGIRTADFSVS